MIMVIWLSVIQYDYGHIVLWLLPIWPLAIAICSLMQMFNKILNIFILWNIALKREFSKCVATYVYAPFIFKLYFTLRGDTGMLGKSENIDMSGRPTNTRADNICLSMTSSVCSVTPGVTAGYLHTKVSERLTRSDVTRSECTATQTKTLRKPVWDGNLRPCLPEWQFCPAFIFFFLLQLCLCFPFFFFLPPSSRRCITSARPCLMTYFFGWLWITVSAESSNLERRHSGVARKATYVSPPVNLPELHFCSLESCPNINMMCQPCKWT